jgi:hypothetical protein
MRWIACSQGWRVWNRFNEARAKKRSRGSENNVRIPTLARERISRWKEVGLGDVAPKGVSSPGDDEQVVHFAVTCPVGAPLEPRFADRTILRDEPWHRVLRPIQGGNRDQGILRRARSACGRLRVARETLVGVEAGTEPVVRAFGHDLDISEPPLPILEERSFVRSKTIQRGAGIRRVTAHTWVYRS